MRLFYQLFYLITLKLILDTERAGLLIKILVPSIGYAFFAKAGLNAVLVQLGKNHVKQATTFSDTLFFAIYPFFVLLIDGSWSPIALVLTYLLYRIQRLADVSIIEGDNQKYISKNNFFYGLLTAGILLFLISEPTLVPQKALTLALLSCCFFVTLIQNGRYFNLDVLIVQGGSLFSLALGTIHSTALMGNTRINYSIGKSIGELPFNVVGYHLSNLLHSGQIKFFKRNLEALMAILTIIYATGSFLLLLQQFNIDRLFGSVISSSLTFFVLIPLFIVNMYVTRRLQSIGQIKFGTVSQVLSNATAYFLFTNSSSATTLLAVYSLPFSVSSLIAFAKIFYDESRRYS